MAGLYSGISNTTTRFLYVIITCALSKPRSVQSSRWDGAIFLMIPDTSCLATIVLSLRDKSHSPIEAPHNYLSAYGAKPWAKFSSPFGIVPNIPYFRAIYGGHHQVNPLAR